MERPNCKAYFSAQIFADMIGLPESWRITDIAFDAPNNVFVLGITRPDWEQELTPKQLEVVNAIFHCEEGRIAKVTWMQPSAPQYRIEVPYRGAKLGAIV